MNGKLPPSFKVRIPWFLGVETVEDGQQDEGRSLSGAECSYEIEIFLRLHTKRDRAPYFTLDAPALPVVVREATVDAAKFLASKLDDAFLVGLGKYHAPAVADLASG